MNLFLKLLIAILCFCVMSASTAQVIQTGAAEEKPKTALEAFVSKKGNLIVKNFYEVGDISGNYGGKAELKAVEVFEPGNVDVKVKGMKVEVKEGGQYAQTRSAFLDLEEIESLISALDYIGQTGSQWYGVSREYTEVVFRTKDDFEIGFYQNGTEQKGFLVCGAIGSATLFMKSPQDFVRIRDAAQAALNKLAQ